MAFEGPCDYEKLPDIYGYTVHRVESGRGIYIVLANFPIANVPWKYIVEKWNGDELFTAKRGSGCNTTVSTSYSDIKLYRFTEFVVEDQSEVYMRVAFRIP